MTIILTRLLRYEKSIKCHAAHQRTVYKNDINVLLNIHFRYNLMMYKFQ